MKWSRPSAANSGWPTVSSRIAAEKRVVAIVLATNGGTPGGSGLKDEEVAVEFSGAVPDVLPARNRS